MYLLVPAYNPVPPIQIWSVNYEFCTSLGLFNAMQTSMVRALKNFRCFLLSCQFLTFLMHFAPICVNMSCQFPRNFLKLVSPLVETTSTSKSCTMYTGPFSVKHDGSMWTLVAISVRFIFLSSQKLSNLVRHFAKYSGSRGPRGAKPVSLVFCHSKFCSFTHPKFTYSAQSTLQKPYR